MQQCLQENKENSGPHSSRGFQHVPLVAAPNSLSRISGFIISEDKSHPTLSQVLENRLQLCSQALGDRHCPHEDIYPRETYAIPLALSLYGRQHFSFLLEDSHWDYYFFLLPFTLMASLIHSLTNINHTSIKSQPLCFDWGDTSVSKMNKTCLP